MLREFKSHIKEIRQMVKYVRAGPINQPLGLGVPTRWNSTFLMIKAMDDNKEFYKILQTEYISYEISQHSFLKFALEMSLYSIHFKTYNRKYVLENECFALSIYGCLPPLAFLVHI